jgi:aspartate carbamoyltransferase catalytic subunit
MGKTDHQDGINGQFKGKDILSLDQFSPKDIEILFKHTSKMREIGRNARPSDILKGNIVTLIFYEPSSRTFNSHAAAVKQLGGATIEIHDISSSSVAKGESLEDTIRVFEAYSDLIVIRHPIIGSVQKAADAAEYVPVINAGDGPGSHPTQALLDLYTIYQKFNRLDNIKAVLCGDVLHSRTHHSLIEGLSLYPNNTVYLVSPKELKLAKDDFDKYSKRNIKLVEIHDEKDIPKDADVWYWNRIQKERFEKPQEAEKYKDKFILTKHLLKERGNENMIILDPLPRVGEINIEVDKDPRAEYLRNQVRNGMYVRMALIGLVLGKL